MSNDELQKAIDDITNNNVMAGAAPTANAAAENEQLANELAGEAPAAAGVAEFAPAPAPMPEVPTEPAMPPMPETVPVNAAAPEMAEAPVASAPEVRLNNAPVSEASVSDSATLEEAMRELYPLLDKVEMPIMEKFEITMKYGEPAKALELAKQMTDEAAKARALLDIIEKLK